MTVQNELIEMKCKRAEIHEIQAILSLKIVLRRSRSSAKTIIVIFCLFLCAVVSEVCNRPNTDEIFEKSNCAGYEIAVHSVWTELQCLDSCLRHPICDKYIFDRLENPTCKLLYTGDIANVAGALRLPRLVDQCTSKIATAVTVSVLDNAVRKL